VKDYFFTRVYVHTKMLSILISNVQLVQEPDSRWTGNDQGDDRNDGLVVEWHGFRAGILYWVD